MNAEKVKIHKQGKFLTKVKTNDDKIQYDFKVEEKDVDFDELKDKAESKEIITLKAKKSDDKDEPSN